MNRSAFVTIVFLTLIGCTQKKDTKDYSNTAASEAKLAVAADKIVASYSKDLKGTLMNAIKDHGISQSINICADEAPQIGADHSNQAVRIYRISDRYRNQGNYANEHQQTILANFADSLANITSYQEWLESDSQKTFFYYKPIRIGPFCLQCHGTSEKISSEVATLLDEKYPNDKARNYVVNELRGMFVVEIDWPEANEFLENQSPYTN